MAPLVDAFGRWPHTSIELRTRMDKPIDNLQPWELSRFEWDQLANITKYERAGAVRVGDACPVYNCHGLTFGNRRTSVSDDPNLIALILDDDEFTSVLEDSVRTGDIILYYDAAGSIEHSGIVLSKGPDPLDRPWIWSKWGKGYAMTHYVAVCPFVASHVRYYRLTKWKPEEVWKPNS